MTRGLRLPAWILAAAVLCAAGPARAVYECGGEYDTCVCGRDNFCLCDGVCGNCVWHAWHSACCHWSRALEWCTDAQYFNDQASSRGYPTGATPRNGSIFVCEPSASCSDWGHVGWVVTAYPDGSFDSTEQSWGGPCGTFNRHRAAGFATGGFIYDPSGTPVETDDAAFVSETVPDGTRFPPGASFTKRWTMRNSGTSTWTRAGNVLLAFDGDRQFGAADQTLLPEGVSIAPGATHDFDVAMTAPATPGTHRGYWRMDRYGTARFGERVWVEIVVEDAPVDADGDGYPAGSDCDDGDDDVHPGAEERCNGFDDDCDGATDEACGGDGGTDAADPDADRDGSDPDAVGLDGSGWDGVRPRDGGDEATVDGSNPASGGSTRGCGCRAVGAGDARGIAWAAWLLPVGLLRRRRR